MAMKVLRPFVGLISVHKLSKLFVKLVQLTCNKEKDLILFINVLMLLSEQC